jgi:DNA-binding response OmpR family regulator
VVLDEAGLTLAQGSAVMPPSLSDFRLFGPLFDPPGRVWSREALRHLTAGARMATAPRILDVKLNRTSRLRDALGHDPIRSIRGQGYALDPH